MKNPVTPDSEVTGQGRREWLQGIASLLMAGGATTQLLAEGDNKAGALRIATFRFDVTPPTGHPLCGGWITPVVDVEDELEANGFVLLGAGKPVVICAVDWTGLLNDAHVRWRTALAAAAETSPERVAVHCVHQHDAPFVCLRTQEILDELKEGLVNVDKAFFDSCLSKGAAAVSAAVRQAVPLTHVAHAQAKVERIAGNRRLALGPDGKVRKMRGSACTDPELIAMPEGLIDPFLKTIAFYSGERKVAVCHYYACHPMSHYGKGHVSSDFPGLARKRCRRSDPDCGWLYFTGAAGNIAAGKYNDGSPRARAELTERLYRAMITAEAALKPEAIKSAAWSVKQIVPEVNPVFTEENQRQVVNDKTASKANRIRAAMRLAWMERIKAKTPVVLSALHLNEISLLHLPAESFVEYQLRAQEMAPDRFVATAAYGDGGSWYIPTREAFPQAGYEVSVANSAESMDALMSQGFKDLVQKA